jgi:hypothetical protein
MWIDIVHYMHHGIPRNPEKSQSSCLGGLVKPRGFFLNRHVLCKQAVVQQDPQKEGTSGVVAAGSASGVTEGRRRGGRAAGRVLQAGRRAGQVGPGGLGRQRQARTGGPADWTTRSLT